jgi:serine/threonine-protein kinase RsbW
MSNESIQHNKIIINSSITELDKVRSLVKEIAEEFKIDETTAFKLSVAVEEACVNLIKHSYKNDPRKEIEIEFYKEDKELKLLIKDNGPSFDPRSVLPVELNQILKKYQKGGLGIILIANIVDKIEYIAKDEKRPYNKLVLTKILE